MDDGWFGAPTDDTAGLGDWCPNPGASRTASPPLEGVRGLGMRAGLWVEPEMVNPDSDLYRAHPDWVLTTPNAAARHAQPTRAQLRPRRRRQ